MNVVFLVDELYAVAAEVDGDVGAQDEHLTRQVNWQYSMSIKGTLDSFLMQKTSLLWWVHLLSVTPLNGKKFVVTANQQQKIWFGHKIMSKFFSS